MPTLVLRFPGRRYHATPWGHHVNEGLIEWPPSPWRLLRALLAVGYSALGWPAALNPPLLSRPPEVAQRLLAKLASVLPDYALPPARGVHSRHYMPVGELKGDRERTTLVFDTWAQIESGVLAVRWDVALAEDEAQLLARLARNLNYLGRSESWVQAELADGNAEITFNCRPETSATGFGGPGWEQVPLLAAQPAVDFATWREAALNDALSAPEVSGAKGARLKKLQAAAQAPYPEDTLACLHADTTFLRQHGWSQPPGSRRVLYWRRADALRLDAASGVIPAASTPEVTVVLLALNTASGNFHALPPTARTLPQAERLHAQLVALRMRLAPAAHSSVLTGCDAAGQALRGAHRHAHVLPLDLDDDRHIDHILLWAPAGLDRLDQQAVRAVRTTYTRGGVGPLRMAWVGAGSLADLSRLPHPFGTGLLRSIGQGRQWLSSTPFVPPRYLKPKGRNSWKGQVQAELLARGLPEAVAIDLLQPSDDEHARRLRLHVRHRQKGAAPPVDVGLTLRLTFAQPVQGPLCLGYGSHFGLGRFECVAGE